MMCLISLFTFPTHFSFPLSNALLHLQFPAQFQMSTAYSSTPPPLAKPSNGTRSSPHSQQLGSQPNSPADSAIGTASDSVQSPQMGETSQRQNQARSTTMPMPMPSSSTQPSTSSEAKQPPRPSKTGLKNGRIGGLGLPLTEKVLCERDYERIVKETELLVGGEGTSRAQLMAESRLSRECMAAAKEPLEEWEKTDRVQESKRYYYFDPVRHEYRLYYSKEVRLRSESNLTALGLDEEPKMVRFESDLKPLRRRHSAGTGRLRRAVPPPKNELIGTVGSKNGTENGLGREGEGATDVGIGTATTRFPPLDGQQNGKNEWPNAKRPEEKPQEEAQPIRRGAFERNSTSRKPVLAPRSLSSEPPRRRQWSGGAKRAALKQQELEQQRRMAGGGTKPVVVLKKKPIPAVRQNGIGQQSGGGMEGSVTNQMLKQLLRPLPQENEDLPWADDNNQMELSDGKWNGLEQEKQRLLGPSTKQQGPSIHVPMPIGRVEMEREGKAEEEKRRKRNFWDCFRGRPKKAKNEQKKRRKTLPESDRPPNKRLQRYIAYLLVPLFVLVAAAAVAIVVIIWYI